MKTAIFISFLVASLTGCSTFTGMSKQAHVEHDTCMYMLLDNGQPGNTCKWHTEDEEGVIRIVMIKPNLCHVLISNTYKQKSKKIEACYDNNNKWKFYDR